MQATDQARMDIFLTRIRNSEDCILIHEDLLIGLIDAVVMLAKRQNPMACGGDVVDVIMRGGPDRLPRVLPTGMEGSYIHKLTVAALTGDDLEQFIFRRSRLAENRRISLARLRKEIKKYFAPNKGVSVGVFGKTSGGCAPDAAKHQNSGLTL